MWVQIIDPTFQYYRLGSSIYGPLVATFTLSCYYRASNFIVKLVFCVNRKFPRPLLSKNVIVAVKKSNFKCQKFARPTGHDIYWQNANQNSSFCCDFHVYRKCLQKSFFRSYFDDGTEDILAFSLE